jgi:enterochelin esterase-like enzyme
MRVWFGRLIIWLLLAFILAGCAIDTEPLPTLAATAFVPQGSVGQPVGFVPATYTAVSQQPVQETVAPTIEPTPTLQPSLTPTALPTVVPTPSPAPLVVLAAPAGPSGESSALYYDTPPRQTDCNGRGLVLQSHFPSGVGGPWRSYHAYVPPCYGQDGRTYPVVYLIHGSIQTDSHWVDLGLAPLADAAINDGRYPPFIAIMPYNSRLGNISSGGANSIEGVTVNYLMPFVESVFCTWNAREGRSIGGISRGGYWALEIAFLHTDLFSAVAGHSSHLRFETDPERYNPLATYAESDLSAMRIWLDRGETDFLRVGQNQLSEGLTNAGIAHEYFINPGGHNEAYWAAHLLEYLDWHTAVWPRERSLYPACGVIG